jgi:amino acid transporter
MKAFGGLMLALSAASPASSVFVIVPDVVAESGSGALASMALGAVIAACVAQLYAELGSAFPLAGGEYVMTGRTLGPLAGFVVLGLNLFNSLLAIAVFAQGAVEHLGALQALRPPPGAAPIAAAGAVVAAALLAVLRIRTNAWITGLFVGVELVALAVVAGLGFAHPVRQLAPLVAHPVMAGAHGALATASLAAIGLSAAAALFAYDGYGSAVYFGEEMHEAPRRIGRAIVGALAITVVAEAVPLAAVFLGAPDLKRLVGSETPFMDFARDRGGPALALTLSVAVGLALANAAIATVLLTARQLYCTARDQTWGGRIDGLFGRVSVRLQSPWAATLAAGALGAALCFVPAKELVIATGSGTALVYAALCVATLVGRRSGATAHGPHRAPLGTVLPVATLLALAGVLFSDLFDADGRAGLGMALGLMVVFAAWYLAVLRRRRGGWRPHAEDLPAPDAPVGRRSVV